MITSLWQQLSAWAEPWADYMLAALVDASVGLVVVLAIWLVVRRRLSARWCYLLFLLVPLKTLIPIEAPFLPAVTAQQADVPAEIPLPTGAEQPSVSPSPLSAPLPSSRTPRPTVTDVEVADRPAADAAALHPTHMAMLMLAWAAIVILLVGRMVWNQYRLMRRLKDSQRAAWDGNKVIPSVGCENARSQKTVPLLISQDLEVPAVVGLIRPRIVLPAGLVATLPDRQIACVIAHELAHLRWRDMWVALFERLVRIVHFANPALWLAAHGAHIYREMACDDASLEANGMDRRACGATLLGVLEFAHRQPRAAAPAIAMFEHARFQERRLRRIMTAHVITRRMGWWNGLLLLGAVILVVPNLRPALPAAPVTQPALAGDDVRPPSQDQAAHAADQEQSDVLSSIAQGGPTSEESYDVSDLARNPSDVSDLADLATNVVLLENWSSVGGVGTIEPDDNARRLHIRQCAGAHEGVQRLLAGLRAATRNQAATASGRVLPAPRGIGLFRDGDQILRLYTVPSLLYADPAVRDPATADYDELIRVTTGVVGPDSWDDVGGPGTIDVWPHGSCVVISQSAEYHARIEQLYTALHALPAVNSGHEPGSWDAVSLSRETMTFPSRNETFDMETKLYALHDLLPVETLPSFEVSPRAIGVEQLAAWLGKQAGLQHSGELVGLNRCRTKGALILTMQPAVHRRIADSLADLRARLKQARAPQERTAILAPVFAPAFRSLEWGLPSFTSEDASPNRVYLHGACRADEQLVQLGPLADSVQEVQLIDADVTDQGLDTLSTLGMIGNLTIWSDRVTDVGVAKLTALQGVSYLSLHSTEVTDASVTSLALLQPLHRLDLSYTSITDEGLKSLLEAMKSRQHLELNVSHTKVSPAAVDLLRAAVPHWRIVY